MTYHSTDAYGITRIAPSLESLKGSLEGLQDADGEAFPEVSLQHANGHVLTYTLKGNLIWEDPRLGDQVRMATCEPEEVLERWQMLMVSDLEGLAAQRWDRVEEW